MGPLILILTLGGSGFVLLTFARESQEQEKRRAEQDLEALLKQASLRSSEYVKERRSVRQAIQKSLRAVAQVAAGEAQVILQSRVAEYRERSLSWEQEAEDSLDAFKWLDELFGRQPKSKIKVKPRQTNPLDGCQPFLRKILPQNCALTLLEEKTGTILRLPAAAGKASGKGLTGEYSRELLLAFDGRNHLWTIRVVAADPQAPPEPTASELARFLAARLKPESRYDKAFRGMILDKNLTVLETFPGNAPNSAELPLLRRSGRWETTGDERRPQITRLEKTAARTPCSWGLAGQIVIPAPSAWQRVRTMLDQDRRWAVFLGVAILATIASLFWGFRSGRTGGRPDSDQRATAKVSEIRLVRKPGGRPVSENARVLLAEIASGPAGKNLTVGEGQPLRQAPRPRSLVRLLEKQRGTSAVTGSRILDHARSPLLRELAKKVRPRKKTAQNTPREQFRMIQKKTEALLERESP